MKKKVEREKMEGRKEEKQKESKEGVLGEDRKKERKRKQVWCVRFSQEPADQSVVLGERVVLSCVVFNYSGIVQWTKDGLALGIGEGLRAGPGIYTMYCGLWTSASTTESQCRAVDDSLSQCQATEAPCAQEAQDSIRFLQNPIHYLHPPLLSLSSPSFLARQEVLRMGRMGDKGGVLLEARECVCHHCRSSFFLHWPVSCQVFSAVELNVSILVDVHCSESKH
ncbi:kin of IRRE-like protein 1b [Lates japonicus]|uniref:Kin of IRRE-like protein 1b n=1 Tax=Lates japonicus TaxID=270547 RepID=A0AAD3NQG8_LATJO|nr:kin of IRRE-like protein 1b [Lates japonicus]